jgi:hypothetical protein
VWGKPLCYARSDGSVMTDVDRVKLTELLQGEINCVQFLLISDRLGLFTRQQLTMIVH